MIDFKKAQVEMALYHKNCGRQDEFNHLFSTWQISELLKRFKDMPNSMKEMFAFVLDLENRDDPICKMLLSDLKSICAEAADKLQSAKAPDNADKKSKAKSTVKSASNSSHKMHEVFHGVQAREKPVKFDEVLDDYVDTFAEEIGKGILGAIDARDYCRIQVDLDVFDITDCCADFAQRLQIAIKEYAQEAALFETFDVQSSGWCRLALQVNQDFEKKRQDLRIEKISNMLDGYPFPVVRINAAIREIVRVKQAGQMTVAITSAMVGVRKGIENPESTYEKFTRRSNMFVCEAVLQGHSHLYDLYGFWYATACAQYWEHLNDVFDLNLPWISKALEIAERFQSE